MPETKYTTQIYLAVRSAETEPAGKAAITVYQDFLGRLMRTAPSVKDLRLTLEEPGARKGTDGVFECWANLKAVVPDTLRSIDADNARDAWRSILRTTFNYSCHHNHELVYHTSSRVEFTREVLPHEEMPEVEQAPKEEKPKVMVPVKVTLGGKDFEIEVPKDENLLDGVNDKGVDVKWDCKNGVCDTCRVQVVKGMEYLPPPNDNEMNMLGDLVKQGWRLSCQINATGPLEIKQ